MQYPANIINDDYDQHRIHRGRGLDRAALLADRGVAGTEHRSTAAGQEVRS